MQALLLAAALALDPASFRAITFSDKPATVYERDGDALKMVVKRSASALVQAFARARVARRVRFDWRVDGHLAVKDAAAQKTKEGDDAIVRVGLLIAGEPPLMPMFAPAWLRAVRDALTVPAARVLFIVAGGPSIGGERWQSPYDEDIAMLAATPAKDDAAWHGATAELPAAEALAGIWLMADGDDSGSTFTAWIRRLELD